MKDHLIAHLVAATHEVFETMAGTTLRSCPPIEPSAFAPMANVVATVGFAGGISGLVTLYSGFAAARAITGAMLGMEAAEVNGEMPDAMGEMANMIAGLFRSKLVAEGLPCDISIPTVTVGSDFSTRYGSEVTRVLCPFEMGNEEIFVGLALTGN